MDESSTSFDFGVHRNHPHKIKNRIVKTFYIWMLDKKIGSKTSRKGMMKS